MAFELIVTSSPPLSSIGDLEEAVVRFLVQVGYMSRNYEVGEGGRGELALRLFMDHFLMRQEKAWTVDELTVSLKTTKPTVYRHLNKLKAMGVVEEVQIEEPEPHKGFRIRYGDISMAWNISEAHVETAMKNYRASIEHIKALAEERRHEE